MWYFCWRSNQLTFPAIHRLVCVSDSSRGSIPIVVIWSPSTIPCVIVVPVPVAPLSHLSFSVSWSLQGIISTDSLGPLRTFLQFAGRFHSSQQGIIGVYLTLQSGETSVCFVWMLCLEISQPTVMKPRDQICV